MHRPFMRVAVVLALLVCALSVHGRHSDDSGQRPAVVHTVVTAADDSHVAAVPDLSTTPRTDASRQHKSHGDACGDASSVHRPAGTLTPVLMTVAVSPAAAADHTSRATRPPAEQGRNLLLLGCVSRR